MFQSKAESGPYTLWYKFDDDALKRRYSSADYARAVTDLTRGAEQVARCYIEVVGRDESEAVGGVAATAWCALNWEAPSVLQGFELKHERTLILPRSWVAQEVFWTVLDRRARGEAHRIFREWMRVALVAIRAEHLDQDPFVGWFGGADVFRGVIKRTWARVGEVLNVCSGLAPKGKGVAPNGCEIEVARGEGPDVFHLGGPELPWRAVPSWGIDMLAWQTLRDLLLEAAEAVGDAPPPPPPPSPPPSPPLIVPVPQPVDPRPRTTSMTGVSADPGPRPVSYKVIAPCEIPGTYKAVPLAVGAVLEPLGIGAVYRGPHGKEDKTKETRVNDACLGHLLAQGWVRAEYASAADVARAEFDALLE